MNTVFLCVLMFILAAEDVWSRELQHTKAGGDKIVGGYDTTIDMYPYQVLILISVGPSGRQCGGSIISDRYVLTAAHCIVGVINFIIVLAGTTDGLTGRQIYNITRRTGYVKHPRYNNNTKDFDVALLKLPVKMNINNVTTKVVTLANTREVPNGEEIVISGWGATSENGTNSDDLNAVKVKTISSNACRRIYRFLTDAMFCAGLPKGGKDACQGDSGGPAVLTSTGKQVGIVSFGYGCARPGIPGVYSRVGEPDIRNWIKRISKV